ncbi:response regulator transcription factor [Enterococcus timonensis]|uniref:response regulator transcription factor n=1 Tax=Enterococcus timonensis TaxID=1852364 RepID=UPI0008D99023|nr:response regulator [Enterococcus timonensis]
MKQVLIVDDEPAIQEGLPLLIDWKSLGYEICAVAPNGKEGLAAIKKFQPDVVITDIRMPILTGLEMLKEAQKQGHTDFYAIILSGYSDFSYAKEAIHIGAASYLLKPIDEDELIEILKKISQENRDFSPKNDTQILFAKIFGNDQSGYLRFGFIRNFRVQSQEVAQQLKTIGESEGFSVVILGHVEFFHVLFLSKEEPNDLRLPMQIQKIDHQEILISNWLTTDKNLQEVYDQIRFLGNYTFLYPNQHLVYDQVLRRQKNSIFNFSMKKIAEALVIDKSLSTILATYWEHFTLVPVTSQEICWQVQKDYEQVEKYLQSEKGMSIQEVNFYNEIKSLASIDQVKEVVNEKYFLLLAQVQAELNSSNIVARIQKYSAEHLSEDLSLKKMAELFNYNRAYLGKKFTRQVGQNYLDYLEEVRMEKAQQLLQTSNLMVYEIAEMVGIPNVDYFYKKFKAFFHASPNDFRGGQI